MSDKILEHQIGEECVLELPEARGGSTRFVVQVGSSCTQCDLTGLGHSTCTTVACSREERSDGNGIVYRKIES